MGLVKGLKGINARIEAAEQQSSGDSVKTEWFKLEDKQQAKVIFLQELDEDSPNYSAKNGLAFLAVEHSNPDNFKRKALCTIDDEGACWACEENRRRWANKDAVEYKGGWKQKSRLYANVAVEDAEGNHSVKILSQGISSGQITPALIEQAGEAETITDKYFKIKRKGAGFNDTSYILTASSGHDKNVEDFELFDLEKVVRNIPYAEQEAHYLDGNANVQADTAKADAELVGASTSAEETDWV